MAHSSLIAPALTGGRGSPKPARSHVARRRRIVVAILLALVVGVSVLVNYSPLTAYRGAHARLDAATAQVTELQKQKEQLQTELGKLTEAGYLESLARQELTYAKPGEEIYVVPPQDETTAAGAGSASEQAGKEPGAGQKPGFLERILSAIGDLF
jgi:cell division protein FtsB